MKAIKVSILVALSLLLCLFAITSCGKDDVTELVIPTANFDLSFSSFELKNGDELRITPKVDTSKSSSGLEIREVVYYWDGKQISTESSSPFQLKYEIANQSIGEHYVNVEIAYGGKGYVTMRTKDKGFEFKVDVVE